MRRILLVNAGNDAKYNTGGMHWTCYPPLGVISLATHVNARTSWRASVIDGQMVPTSEICSSIVAERPDVVGVSVLATSYHNAIRLAHAAHEVGAVTVFGNDQPAVTGHHMMRVRREVDYVCAADEGERPLVEILEYLDGVRSVEEVGGLVYRKDGTIVENELTGRLLPWRRHSLDDVLVPDRELLSTAMRARYTANYRFTHRDRGVTGTTTINRFRGCSKVKRPCTYCGIQDLRIRTSSPEMFWSDIRGGLESGANRFFEAGDSLSSVPRHLRMLADARPRGIDAGLFVYVSAREPEWNHRRVDGADSAAAPDQLGAQACRALRGLLHFHCEQRGRLPAADRRPSDPPLFLGYLRGVPGVPFFWTLHLWAPWAFVLAVLLVLYFIWDSQVYRSTGTRRRATWRGTKRSIGRSAWPA